MYISIHALYISTYKYTYMYIYICKKEKETPEALKGATGKKMHLITPFQARQPTKPGDLSTSGHWVHTCRVYTMLCQRIKHK